MGNKLAERLLNKTANVAKAVAENPGKSIADQAPVTMPGQLGAFRLEAKKYQERIDRLEEELKLAKEQGGAAEIPLEELHEVSGRRRLLSARQYEELKQNLSTNPLVTPITVRRRAEGGFEIVSGNNRVSVFRDLGRAHIPARLLDSDDRQADINAFYANLLQPDLPDFEKYLGFKKIMAMHGKLTHAEIAAGAGVSRSFVSQLMAFDELPVEVLDMLRLQPAILGANAAQDLATLAKKGFKQQVVEAVEKLAAGALDQTKAVKEVQLFSSPQKTKTPAETMTIRAGRSTYCRVVTSDKHVRLQFQNAEELELVKQAILEVLENRARALKKEKGE